MAHSKLSNVCRVPAAISSNALSYSFPQTSHLAICHLIQWRWRLDARHTRDEDRGLPSFAGYLLFCSISRRTDSNLLHYNAIPIGQKRATDRLRNGQRILESIDVSRYSPRQKVNDRDSGIKRLAAPQGFEPRYADPESAVLPLNEGAVVCGKIQLRFDSNKQNGSESRFED